MRNQDKKILLFVIATIVTSFGIGYTMLKGTSATNTLSDVPANPAFDDINFYKCVVDAYNGENNTSYDYTTSLSDEELETITKLDCSAGGLMDEEKIDNSNGIEKLINLEYLYITENNLTELNVKNNIKLKYLYVSSNQLTSLDISKNTDLTRLDIGYWCKEHGYNSMRNCRSGNMITELDLTNNSKLSELYIADNPLTNLDLSKNFLLRYVTIVDTPITNLDLSNTIVTNVEIMGTELKKIDFGTNEKIRRIKLDDNNLTELDLTYATILESLSATQNNLTNIVLGKKDNLSSISLGENELKKIDVTGIPNLKSLDLGYRCYSTSLNRTCNFGNKIETLDLSKNTALISLFVNNNNLETLDLSNNTQLTTLYAYSNNLRTLDLSNNTNLTKVYLYKNQLDNIKFGDTCNLKNLEIFDNNLTSLNLSNAKSLISLYAYSNLLEKVEIQNPDSLAVIDLRKNKLKTLDISEALNLESLYLGGSLGSNTHSNEAENLLTNLDVSNNTLLTALYLESNQLTSLDVSNNVLLKTLELYNNKLTGLDLSNNSALTSLSIDSNPYSETLYVYKGNSVNVGSNVKIVSHLNWNSPTWISGNTDIVTVDENGMVTALGIGNVDIKGTVTGKYTTTSTINVVEITSDKYKIDKDNGYIFIGYDKDVDVIKSSISMSDDDISIDVDMENYKLYVKYNNKILEEFNLIYIDINGYETLNKSILVSEDVSYDNFINAIIVSEGITYKLYSGDVEVTSGNILKDMVLKIYYKDEEIYEYLISNEYVKFDESLSVDNMIIRDILVNTTIDFIKDKIDTSGSIDVLDKNNNVLAPTDKLKTGDKFRVNLPSQTLTYSISVMGDVNGDGNITREDIELSSKHIIKGNLITGAEYLKAIDMDNNNVANINDIIKMVKQVKVSD